MAQLTPQFAGITGVQATFASASGGGDTFPLASPGQKLIIRNASGSAITVTLVVPGNNEDNLANPDPTYTVLATTGVSIIGGFTSRHVDPNTGLIGVTYSGVTSLTVAVIV